MGEARLSRSQSRTASSFLRKRWTAGTTWGMQTKVQVVNQVNALFVSGGEPSLYSVRKLDDWLSNARYRHNCKQRTHLPHSWSSQSRAANRAANRAAKLQQKRAQPSSGAGGDSGGVAALAAVKATVPPTVGSGRPAEPGTRVQTLLRTFQDLQQAVPHPAAQKQRAMQHSALFGGEVGPDDWTSQRSIGFSTLRDQFEQGQYGRTEPWACHRGWTATPSRERFLHDPAHFIDGFNANGSAYETASSGATDAAHVVRQVINTFLTIPGLPIPNRIAPASVGVDSGKLPRVKPTSVAQIKEWDEGPISAGLSQQLEGMDGDVIEGLPPLPPLGARSCEALALLDAQLSQKPTGTALSPPDDTPHPLAATVTTETEPHQSTHIVFAHQVAATTTQLQPTSSGTAVKNFALTIVDSLPSAPMSTSAGPPSHWNNMSITAPAC